MARGRRHSSGPIAVFVLALALFVVAAPLPAWATASPPDGMKRLGTVELPGSPGGFGHAVDGFTIDPQGHRAYVALNAGGEEPSLQVVDLRNGTPRVIGEVRGHTVGSVAVSADGGRLYAAYDTDRIAVFDVTSPTPVLIRTVKIPMLRPKLAVSPDGRTLYVGNPGGVFHAISAYRLPGLTKLPFRPEVSVDISRMAVSPDGSQLAVTGSFDGHLVTVDTATAVVHEVRGEDVDDATATFAFSGDSRGLLIESDTDDAMILRRADSRSGAVERERSLSGETSGELAASPDDRFVYLSGDDGLLRVLDASTLRTERRVRLPDTESVAKVAVATDPHSTAYGRVVTVQDGDALDGDAHPVLAVYEQHGLGDPASAPTGAAGHDTSAEAAAPAAPGEAISATPHDSPVRLVLAGAAALGAVAALAGIGVLYARGRL